MLINGSSPTTHASCPGGIDPTSPGPNSASEPSSIRTTIRPEGDVDEVANLATVGPNSRFNTLRPAPSRLMDHARDLDTTQVHELDLALVKGSCFFHALSILNMCFRMNFSEMIR